jgi:hypothetical protein
VSQSLVIGPFALPWMMLLLFAAAGSALLVGDRLARKAGVVVEPVLWRTLLVGLLVARLAFVWEFRSAYGVAPLGILDIRDGGWNATAGFVGAWLYVLSRHAKRTRVAQTLAGGDDDGIGSLAGRQYCPGAAAWARARSCRRWNSCRWTGAPCRLRNSGANPRW